MSVLIDVASFREYSQQQQGLQPFPKRYLTLNSVGPHTFELKISDQKQDLTLLTHRLRDVQAHGRFIMKDSSYCYPVNCDNSPSTTCTFSPDVETVKTFIKGMNEKVCTVRNKLTFRQKCSAAIRNSAPIPISLHQFPLHHDVSGAFQKIDVSYTDLQTTMPCISETIDYWSLFELRTDKYDCMARLGSLLAAIICTVKLAVFPIFVAIGLCRNWSYCKSRWTNKKWALLDLTAALFTYPLINVAIIIKYLVGVIKPSLALKKMDLLPPDDRR